LQSFLAHLKIKKTGFEFTTGDSYWFAYITALTVGLGDFYLQPEGLFVSDVFNWSSRLLGGFVVVSTFLGKVGDLISSFLPKRKETFCDYLQRTDAWGNIIDVPERTSLETLKYYVEAEEKTEVSEVSSCALVSDNDKFNSRHIQILLEKRHLLLRLLDDTQSELHQRLSKEKKSTEEGGLTLSELKQDEIIFENNLRQAQEIRSELESTQMKEQTKRI
jgi:hypothetical protein